MPCQECSRMAGFIAELRALLDRYAAPEAGDGITLKDAVEACLRSKEAKNLRRDYVTGLRQYLTAFARGREGMAIAAINIGVLERWFADRQEPPGTLRSNLGRLGSMFTHAKRQGWIRESPVDRFDKPRVDSQEVEILTADECRKALAVTMANWPQKLPAVVLAMFCGVRPGEIQRLTWDAINLEAGSVTIGATASKVRMRRTCPISPNAVEWLKACRSTGVLPASPMGWRRTIDRIREAIGRAEWPQDAFRHTAASMMLAREQDAGKVATWLGNSPSILVRHYVAHVGPEECAKFWDILPSESQ